MDDDLSVVRAHAHLAEGYLSDEPLELRITVQDERGRPMELALMKAPKNGLLIGLALSGNHKKTLIAVASDLQLMAIQQVIGAHLDHVRCVKNMQRRIDS